MNSYLSYNDKPEKTLMDYLLNNGFLPLTEANWHTIEVNHNEPKTDSERNETNSRIRNHVGSINGIYIYTNSENEILYVGKGKPVYKRIQNRYKRCYNFHKTTSRIQCAFWSSNKGIVKVYYKELEGEEMRKKIESMLQTVLKPIYEDFKNSEPDITFIEAKR